MFYSLGWQLAKSVLWEFHRPTIACLGSTAAAVYISPMACGTLRKDLTKLSNFRNKLPSQTVQNKNKHTNSEINDRHTIRSSMPRWFFLMKSKGCRQSRWSRRMNTLGFHFCGHANSSRGRGQRARSDTKILLAKGILGTELLFSLKWKYPSHRVINQTNQIVCFDQPIQTFGVAQVCLLYKRYLL